MSNTINMGGVEGFIRLIEDEGFIEKPDELFNGCIKTWRADKRFDIILAPFWSRSSNTNFTVNYINCITIELNNDKFCNVKFFQGDIMPCASADLYGIRMAFIHECRLLNSMIEEYGDKPEKWNIR